MDSLVTEMVYFKRLKKTRHYIEYHEQQFPWLEVVKIIRETKNPRRKEDKFEIKTEKYYVLFGMKNKKVYVINAKRL